MRVDESGGACPETLGEYRDLCAAVGGDDCEAIAVLDEKIAKHGRDEKVVVSDAQARAALFPLLTKKRTK